MGEDVAVLHRSQTGRDDMGEPVWEWSSELVAGCLVRPLAGTDMQDQTSPDGVVAQYSIAFPKSYGGVLRHARVALVARGMDPHDAGAALRVSGSPDVTDPCPTGWNRLATVGAAHG